MGRRILHFYLYRQQSIPDGTREDAILHFTVSPIQICVSYFTTTVSSGHFKLSKKTVLPKNYSNIRKKTRIVSFVYYHRKNPDGYYFFFRYLHISLGKFELFMYIAFYY